MGFTILIILICITALIFVVRKSPRYKRLVTVLSLFKPENIAHNFVNMSSLFPVNEIKASQDPVTLNKNSKFSLPDSFTHKSETNNVEDYLHSSQTSGLIVLKDDAILSEKYFDPCSEFTQHISWSVCKASGGNEPD